MGDEKSLKSLDDLVKDQVGDLFNLADGPPERILIDPSDVDSDYAETYKSCFEKKLAERNSGKFPVVHISVEIKTPSDGDYSIKVSHFFNRGYRAS